MCLYLIVAAVIEREDEILLCKAAVSNGHEVWELPNCIVANEDENPIEALLEKCNTYNVSFEPTGVLYENDSSLVVLRTEILSYLHTPDNTSGSAYWVDARELKHLIFNEQYQEAFNEIIHEYDILFSVSDKIQQSVDKLSEEFGIKANISRSNNSFKVFVYNDYGGYCPFIFSIDYIIETENEIELFHSWNVTRIYADGDKTDFYVLFANCMAILLRRFFQKNVYIDYLSLFDPGIEINAATIIFCNDNQHLNINEVSKIVETFYELFILCLLFFEKVFGSFSLKIDDKMFDPVYLNYFDVNNETTNYSSREEHQYYYKFDDKISLLCINNGVYDLSHLLDKHKWELVEGIDGKILHQVSDGRNSFHYVSNENWGKISKTIADMKIDKYDFICQSNHLYLLEKNNVWIFEGDFSEYWVEIEKAKILDRQAYENSILQFNRKYKWRFPVKAGRFEELIADLLEIDVMVQNVRIVGNANNADGGRDLLIYKRVMYNEASYGISLLIGQCKAYEKSVNKTHVRDIRDTIELYNANGFFLAVTSVVTAQLIDHLCKLKESRDVDWWTEREIFNKLRQNSYIADRYLDILEIEN